MKPVESEIGQVEFDFLMFRPLVDGEYVQIVREGEEIGSLDFKDGCMCYKSPYTGCVISQIPMKFTDRLIHLVVDKKGQILIQFREEGCTLHRSSYADQVTEPSDEETRGFFGLLREFYFEIKELLS